MITDAAVMVAVDATGYRMKFFIDNTDGMMVSGSWHRRVLCPAILNRIIRFVGMSVSSVGAYASCGKIFPAITPTARAPRGVGIGFFAVQRSAAGSYSYTVSTDPKPEM